MTIRVLSTNTINKIAAGEVVDRPLSIVKELVENSIDAGANEIFIEVSRGGRNFISITDNGKGIKKDELELAIERHATSKLNEKDINNIMFLGFRGEALPSIASVSKMKIISKTPDSDEAWEINIEGGKKSEIKPASFVNGTYIEVQDLFFTTPARLKFLKSEASETSACIELVNRLALSCEDISFKFISNKKIVIDTKKQNASVLDSSARIEDILGKQFIENSIKLSSVYEGIKVYGYTSIPTFNSATSLNQYFFINKRIVRDKVLAVSVRAAYRNLIPHNRYPQIVLYLGIDHKFVDVNVHPAKAEVRFRDEQKIKGIIIGAIRNAVVEDTGRSSTKVANDAIRFLTPERYKQNISQKNESTSYIKEASQNKKNMMYNLITKHEAELGKKSLYTRSDEDSYKAAEKKYDISYISNFVSKELEELETTKEASVCTKSIDNDYPLGFAKCQIDKTYIVAEKSDCLILVDQHAAHERLTLEKIKLQLKDGKVVSQMLLVPEIVDLGDVLTERIMEKKQNLYAFGLGIERNGISQILVRQVPTILQNTDVKAFVKAIAENLYAFGDIDLIHEKIEEVWGNIACYSSIRAGRVLNVEEMNALLRDIESTPLSSQCNHGRPTFVKLQLKDIRKIFERL
jgi:DNA mismatch repair protein MutL